MYLIKFLVLFILFLWLLWAVARGVYTLSILFLLTVEYCKLNSLKQYIENPPNFVFYFTMVFIVIASSVLGISIVCVVIYVSMIVAIFVSCNIRHSIRIKNQGKTKPSDD